MHILSLRAGWRAPLLISFLVVAVAVVAALVLTRGRGESADNVLESVDDALLSANFGIDVTADRTEAAAAVDEAGALAAVRNYSSMTDSAPVKEVALAQVRGKVVGNSDYDGRAWIVSLAIVPPFQGGPIPADGKCLAPPLSKYTLDNTFFLFLVDAESGEVLRAFGGTLEPDTPEDLLDCTVVPVQEVPYEPR